MIPHYVRRAGNCYRRVCSKCRRRVLIGGGKLRPVFVCAECLNS